MAKMGRPVKLDELDKEEFEKLCHIQCTRDEIMGWFEVGDDTLNRWCKKVYKKTFEAIFAEKRQGGKISLRRSQFQNATANMNPTMQIWLGKQYLDQQDKKEIDFNTTAKQFVLAYSNEALNEPPKDKK